MPIRSKQELKFYILADRMMNKRTFKYSLGQKVKNIFLRDYIMDWFVAMRKCQYYGHLGGAFSKMWYLYNHMRFHHLSVKLGFSMGYDCLGYGAWIPHYGTIVIGENCRLGRYACLHTATCITATGKQIGEGLYMGTGAKLIGEIDLGNNISVGANSVVNKSFMEEGILIAGAPAVKKKYRGYWYDSPSFQERVDKIEALRREMKIEL